MLWLEHGYDVELDVMAAVERVAARESGQLPTTLGYFRPVIAERAGKRSKRTMPKAPDRVITAENATRDDWDSALAMRARFRRRFGDDVERWPGFAVKWNPYLGPPPEDPDCRAPPARWAERGVGHGGQVRLDKVRQHRITEADEPARCRKRQASWA